MAKPTAEFEHQVSVEQRQLAQRDRELDLKERELTKSPWSNPLIATLAAGVVALAGNIGVSVFNGSAQRTVEQEKTRGNLLLEAIKTGNLKAATCNLDLLVEFGLLPSDKYPGLKDYTDKRATECEGAVLPSPKMPATISSCNPSSLPAKETLDAARAAAKQAGTFAWMAIALNEVGVCESSQDGGARLAEYWASIEPPVPDLPPKHLGALHL